MRATFTQTCECKGDGLAIPEVTNIAEDPADPDVHPSRLDLEFALKCGVCGKRFEEVPR
jgi:hypothetical protein